MTQVIDGKVVEMRFDNSDFEKNVAQSMSTLDKLKQALNFDSAKSLDNVTRSARNFDMSAVGTAVDTVQAKFSALQVIGMTALSELTKSALGFASSMVNKVIEPIKSGGMNRALNIEQAKFQLEGLHVAWEDIQGDIDYAVSGTAYGLDAAAKAAAQLTASGVKLGDEMKAALRGISGVAAMTNASYEEISPIFTTVAGQGKLMTMQLRQLESRGLNAASTLAEYLGVTEAEIRDMVTKGKIDFETFATAMDDAFGEHAKDANKTFSGAMKNVRAALSRIGAKFATPYMENMRKIFVDLIQVINSVNKALDPIVGDVVDIMEYIQGILSGIMQDERLTTAWAYIVETIRELYYEVLLILTPIGEAFRDIFPKKDAVQAFVDATKNIKLFVSSLIISEENAENVKRTFRGLFAVIDIIGMAFKAAFEAIKPFASVLGDLISNLLGVTGDFGDYLVNLRDTIKENDIFGKAFGKVADFIWNAGARIKSALDAIINTFTSFKENTLSKIDLSGFEGFIDSIRERFASLGSVGDMIDNFKNRVKEAFPNLGNAIKNVASTIGESIGLILRGFSEAFKGGGEGDMFTTFINSFSSAAVGSTIASFVQLLAQLAQTIKNVGGLSPLLIQLKATFKSMEAELHAKTINEIAKAILVFAGAIFVLSLINPARLVTSLAAVEVLIYTVEVMMKSLEEMTKGSNMFDFAKLYALGSVMTQLGVAVLILASAIKVLSTIDTLSLIQGLGAVLILMNAMSNQAVLLSNFDTKVMKGASTMIAMAIAIRILASAVKVLGELPLGELAKGLTSTIVAMYALAGAMQVMDKVKIKPGTAAALIATAIAIRILTSAVEALGALPMEQLLKGGIAVSGLILVLGGFVRLAGSSKHMFQVAVAMIAVAASLKILSGVVEDLGKLTDEQLLKGLLSVIILIEALTVSLMMLSGFSKAGGLDYLAISASLVIFAAALNSLTTVFERFEKIGIGTIVKTLVTMGIAIGAFAAAAALLTPLLVPMAALSGIILLLGVGVAALGLGVISLSAGIMMLSTAATVLVANLDTVLVLIAGLIPAIAIAIANGIVLFITTIANSGAALIDAVVKIGRSILQALTILIPEVGQLLITLIDTLVEILVQSIPRIVEGTILLLTGILEGLTRSLPGLIKAFNDFIITLINSLADSVREDTPRLIEAFDNLMDACIEALILWITHFGEKGKEIIEALIEGAKSLLDDISALGKEIVDKAIEAITSFIPNVVQAGKDFIQGFINGIKGLVDGAGGLVEAAKAAGKAALNAVDEAIDSNSPSREMYKRGEYFDEGMANGIKDNAGKIYYAADTVGATTVKKFQDYLDRVEDIREEQQSHVTWAEKKYKEMAKSKQTDTKINEEARQEHIKTKKAIKEEGEATEELTEEIDDLTKATGSATKAQKDFAESIKDTISNQLDMFSKFELKTSMTGQQMIENMRSNIDGFASWSHRMAVLAQRFAEAGIDKGLYQKLAELGPKGYETMNAFYQMSEEELAQVKDLWATGLTLPDSQADIINSGFKYMGEMAAQGFSNALDDHTAAHNAANGLGKSALDGLSEALDVHSPSRKTFQIGVYLTNGLGLGMTSASALTMLDLCVDQVSNRIIDIFNENLSAENMEDIGKGLITNIFASMLEGEDPEDMENPMLSAFILSLENLDLFDEAIVNFVEHLKELLNENFEMADDESPSMLFFRYAQMWIQGIVDAIYYEETLITIILTITFLADFIKEQMDSHDIPGHFRDIGENAGQALADGLLSKLAIVSEAAAALAEAAAVGSSEALDINSPSKVFIALGHSVGEGFVIGLNDSANTVYNAAASLADSGINGAETGMGRLQDVISEELDFNPIITPMLDLSLIRSQMEELNGMMNTDMESAGLYGQNGGKFSANPEGTQINFTQNNYSPKALSRMEIYRQTKNQISMMKGVVANA